MKVQLNEFMDKLKEILEDKEENEEMIPTAIIRDDEILSSLDDELNQTKTNYGEEIEELQQRFQLLHSETWGKIKHRMLEKGLIDENAKYSFSIRGGVIYLAEIKDCESECESEE